MSRFVSRSSDKCQPFFQVLKKDFHWDSYYKLCLKTTTLSQVYQVVTEAKSIVGHLNEEFYGLRDDL